MQINQLLKQAVGALISVSPTPRLDAELLLAYVLSKDRIYVFSHPEVSLTEEQYQRWQGLFEKRLQQYPIAYLLEEKEFWGLMLHVNEHCLIPRPETELLVELVLGHHNAVERLSCLDLGTGTGAIALAIAKERPVWQITAADFSSESLILAEKNAKKHDLEQVVFLKSNWFSAVTKKFDIIISNPPYLSSSDIHLITEEIRYEPYHALVSGEQGLEDVEAIIYGARHHLTTRGSLFIEHGCDQGAAVRQCFDAHGYSRVETFKDLGGLERVTMGLL